jgi:transposase
VRVTTVFNKLLGLDGAFVTHVEFIDSGVVVGIRRRARRHRCVCGETTAARYDRSVRRWRHLDLGGHQVWLEAEIARIWCRACDRVVTEDVPWARPGARHSRAFEDLVAWLAQRMDKTSLARLMRCSWEAVHRIVNHIVAERLLDSRFDGLRHIGVDEISYKRGHKYLTVVVDHDTHRVIWVGTGRTAEVMGQFYAQLGPERAAGLEAVTMDGGPAYISATKAAAPNAIICFDPFHVVKWTTEALDHTFRASAIPALRAKMRQARNNAPWRQARYALRANRENITPIHCRLLKTIRTERRDLHDAWILKEELRDLFAIIGPDEAEPYLRDWIKRAGTSGIRPFVHLAGRLHKHFDRITAAVQLGLSNSRSEGTNAKIRVIQRRGYGHQNPESLTALIYLCCAGMQIPIPTQR